MKLNNQMKTIAAFAALALTSASTSAATFALSNYNSYDNPAQGAATVSPFSTIFGAISEQDLTVESGFTLNTPSYDFRGIAASVTAGQTYFFLEDVQDGQFDSPGAILAAAQVRTNDGRNGSTNSGGNADSIDEDDGLVDGSVGNPRGGIRFGTRVDFNASMLGGNLPTHVGYALAGDSDTVSVTAFNSLDVQLETVTAAHAVGGRAAFAGLTTTEGISYVILTGTETDHFQYGFLGTPIPEPSSTALLGLGGLALILRRRK
jgi:hypothetical protein